MTKDQKMLKIFPFPPMVAYKQPPNLKRTLQSKITTEQTPYEETCRYSTMQQTLQCVSLRNHNQKKISNQSKQTFNLSVLFSVELLVYLTSLVSQIPKKTIRKTNRHFSQGYH
jgi:hypothetical protein